MDVVKLFMRKSFPITEWWIDLKTDGTYNNYRLDTLKYKTQKDWFSSSENHGFNIWQNNVPKINTPQILIIDIESGRDRVEILLEVITQ